MRPEEVLQLSFYLVHILEHHRVFYRHDNAFRINHLRFHTLHSRSRSRLFSGQLVGKAHPDIAHIREFKGFVAEVFFRLLQLEPLVAAPVVFGWPAL